MIVWHSGGPFNVPEFLLGVLFTLNVQTLRRLWMLRRKMRAWR